MEGMFVLEVAKDEKGKLINEVLPVKFAVEGNGVVLDVHPSFDVDFPEEVIIREMSRRELKSYRKK